MANLTEEQKTQVISDLVGNCGCKSFQIFNESDEVTLNATEDERLLELHKQLSGVAKSERVLNQLSQKGVIVKQGKKSFTLNAGMLKPVNGDESQHQGAGGGASGPDTSGGSGGAGASEADEGDAGDEDEDGGMVKPANNRRYTEAEFMALAPPSIVAALNEANDILRNKKQALVKKITANGANGYTPEQLMAKDSAELQLIANLATGGQRQAVVGGQNRAPLFANAGGGQGPTNNANQKKAGSGPLIPPTINFQELVNERKKA